MTIASLENGLVCVFAVVDGYEGHDLFIFVNDVEGSVVADSVSPGFGGVVSEFFDVPAEVGFCLELIVDQIFELFLNSVLNLFVELGEFSVELVSSE